MTLTPLVKTLRLSLVPLTSEQLQTYLAANDRFERQYGLTSFHRTVSPEVRDMIEYYSLPKMKLASREAQLFLTFWLGIDRQLNQVVCELGFKGTPDQDSEVELGYGTFPNQQSKGYMTEAVEGVCSWALARSDVRGILAETEEKNKASIRVVQKNSFIQFDKKDRMLWWRKKKPSTPPRYLYNFGE